MKVALVTGSNSGFGLLTTLRLADEGYHVIATMRKLDNKEALMNAAQEKQLQMMIDCIQMDVINQQEIESVYQYIEKKYSKLDVIINNAGYCQGGFFTELTEQQWLEQFDTNVFGMIRVTRTMLPFLRRNGGGKVVNISSVSGILGYPGMSPYTSSKFAIEGLSESLRLECRHENIWVSLVQPTSYKTNIWEKSLEQIKISEDASDFQKNIYKAAHESKENSADPMEVAQLIVRICESTEPKFRYPVGKGARTLSLIKRIVPWFIIEKVVYSKLGGKIHV